MDIQLLALCPFCGGKPIPNKIRDGYKITCPVCGASGPPAFEPESARKCMSRWNERTVVRETATESKDRQNAEPANVLARNILDDPYGNAAVLAKLKPGEPFFVLRGQDKLAVAAVRQWANDAEKAGIPQAKVENARKCAWAMQDYRPKKMPD